MQMKSKNSVFSLKTAIFSAIISVLIFFSVFALMSAAAYAVKNPGAVIGTCSLGALVLSGAIGGLMLSRLKGTFGVMHAVSSAAVCTVFYLVAALIATGGLGGLHLLNAVCYLGASALGMIIGKGGSKKKRRPR